MITAKALPLTLSESEFSRTVISYAMYRKWKVCHFRAGRTVRGWVTPVEGDVGCPDLILARNGVVLLAELKRHRGHPSPAQRSWLAAAGECGRLWRPMDWPAIVGELK